MSVHSLHERFGFEPDGASPSNAGAADVPHDHDEPVTNKHFASVYEDQQDQFEAIVPFIRKGLDGGERCLYVANDNTETEVIEALRDGGIDVDASLERGQLSVHTKADTYVRAGAFETDQMLEFWEETLAEARDLNGFAGVRAAAEMDWALDENTDLDELARYEAMLNNLYDGDDYVVLCQYDRTRFSPEALTDVILTHPFIVYNGAVCRNFYYHSPEEFFGTDASTLDIDRILDGLVELTWAELAIQERRRDLEEFATAVSHDLTEPLRSVTSYLQLLERRYEEELDEEAAAFIDYAVGGAARMRNRVEALTAAYRDGETGDGCFESVDLNEVLDDVLIDLGTKIDESDTEISADRLPVVKGDPCQLRQLLLNLLDNAIKYSGDAPPEIHLSVTRNGDRWTISIDDDGIGMGKKESDAVFGVFYRAHADEGYSGAGIGLTLCKRIVENHEGEIWVESERGEGSTVSFTLSNAPGADPPEAVRDAFEQFAKDHEGSIELREINGRWHVFDTTSNPRRGERQSHDTLFYLGRITSEGEFERRHIDLHEPQFDVDLH